MILFGTVKDCFSITGRGFVSEVEFDRNLKFRLGEAIQLRSPGRTPFDTAIRGFEHMRKIAGGSAWAILFPPEVTKDDIVVGAEIWLIRDE